MSKAQNHNFTFFIVTALFTVLVTLTCLNGFFSISPVSAANDAARWTRVNIPAEGDAGGWALAGGSDIRYPTTAVDGTMYAYAAGLTYTLLKSTDGGLKWTTTGKVQDVITGIAVSPHDADTVYYATAVSVYRSVNGGKSFIQLPAGPGGASANNIEITSIAAGWLNGNIIAAGTRDTDPGEYGGVYTYDETEIIPSWTDTGMGSYDVYAVAFSPGYTGDRQLTAAVTDETDTYVFSKIGNTGWGDIIGGATLNANNSAPATAVAITESAVIVFPANYSADTVQDCCFYVGINSGAGGGDVYKITGADAPSTSTAADLNASAIYGAANTDITGLSAQIIGEAAFILAGAAGEGRTYISIDGGINWKRSTKSPTGTADTYVLFSRDFSTSGLLYAATGGNGSALSVSRDIGETWDQISLIDTDISSLIDIAPSPNYSLDNTLLMITFGAGPASSGLWRTTDGGLTWERILSGDHPAVDVISRAAMPPQYGNDCRTVYAAGESNGSPAIWESVDSGRIFRSRATCDPATGAAFPIDAWAVAGEKTIYIGSYDGVQGLVYQTTNGGFSYSEGAPAGSNSIYSLALSPDYDNDGTILAGNSAGTVYKSGDGGTSFVPLAAETAAATLSGNIDVAFDAKFQENRTIYAGSDTADAGFYRYDTGAPDYWEIIDGTLPGSASIDRISVAAGGVLYGTNSHAGGGLERCLNPNAANPIFETVTLGLSDGATLSGIRQADNRTWAMDTSNCKLMTYKDTLTLPLVQNSPENDASGIGIFSDHEVKNITIDWEAAEGATSYDYECTFNSDFSAIPTGLEGTVDGSSVYLPPLDAATVYHWRVRVSTPVLSPWSEWRSFTTSLDTEVVALRPESPAAGAAGVLLKPVFQWTAVIGASAYELLAAADAEFEEPVIVKINEFALPTNAWECDVSLDYDTTYYWKVRAVSASTHSAWSSAGVFTTEPAPFSGKLPGNETPELSLMDIQDPMMIVAAPTQKAPPEQLLPPPATNAPAATATPGQPVSIPDWMIFFIGGLLAIVMLALIIVLAVVLKMRRF